MNLNSATSSCSLKERVYQQLFNDIVTGYYKYSDTITEKSLIDRFQVSKTPIREALAALCTEKVLESIPRCGYRIVQVDNAMIHDVLCFRSVLETSMLRENFDRIDDATIDGLCEICAEHDEEVDTQRVFSYWQKNMNFHLRLMQTYGNSYAVSVLAQSMMLLHRAYTQFFWDEGKRKDAAISEWLHDLFIQSLRARDLESACKYLMQDIFGFNDLATFQIKTEMNSSFDIYRRT